jgi:aminobenzoyl-glutamate transport protein
MAEPHPDSPDANANDKSAGILVRTLNLIERLGNKLPDPAVLFLIGLVATWILSGLLSRITFTEIDPRSQQPLEVVNLLSLSYFAEFLAGMVNEFVQFPPLGVVLVALLGVGVAEHSGFINACLKSLLKLTPQTLLTPMLILVAIVSHTAADAGYVLVIPLGGVIFYAAGRHPLAGIAAAFAGVSGDSAPTSSPPESIPSCRASRNRRPC